MNILRLSTFLLITMMLVPIDASAHCKGKHTGDHEHCTGGGGSNDTTPPDPIQDFRVLHLTPICGAAITT